ncbi:AraC family transcriptional regulator [Pseudomonas asiatica]|uniref:helix-turn-helix domain-containing protein n=1 Tax=Pseudomonas asiatica TaxID=2219225 RepID=UPI00209B7FE4|nr:AraC family transcriptional regulator [Pseudomonas asiatica]MCO7524850.1 AraC family transcriptional regulator [Pseudomonas asiatica]
MWNSNAQIASTQTQHHLKAWKSYSDFYLASGYSKFPQQHREATGRLDYRMIHVEQGAHNFADPSVEETILVLPVKSSSNCTWGWQMNGVWRERHSEAGRMLVVPSDTQSRWEVDGERSILVLSLPDSTVKGLLGVNCPKSITEAFALLSKDTWSDPFLETMVIKLWDACSSNDPADGLLSDGLLMSIISGMLKLAGTDLNTNTAVALPQWRIKRVEQYVEANLNSEISIEDLSAAAGLSRRHFSRSFHQELGLTPHRWLMKVRIENAKKLLVDSDFSLCEIAEACGFSSQSHFATAFKGHADTTPSKWRQAYRK